MAYAQLKSRHTPNARVEEIDEIGHDSAHYRLSIPSGSSDSYRLAQLDDYTQFSRRQFSHRASTRLSLSARTSSDSIAGTWGFGLWNDPFGLSLGFGGYPFRLPTLPNAMWFFGASQENYLSFKEPLRLERSEAQTTLAPAAHLPRAQVPGSAGEGASTTDGAKNAPPSPQREIAANGFIAQIFRSPRFHPFLILAGLALPFSRRMTRRMLGHVIEEDGVQLWNPTARRRVQEQAPTVQNRGQSVDPTQWHRYRLDWGLKRASFEVDDAQVFESSVSPNPPLGLVIWIDNQYAAFTPEGKIGMGVLEGEEAWLEIKDLEIRSP